MENNNEVNNLEKESLKNEQTNINNRKNNKKKIWFIISSIIVITVVGIIVYVTTKDKGKSNIKEVAIIDIWRDTSMDSDIDLHSTGSGIFEKVYLGAQPVHYIIDENGELYTYQESSFKSKLTGIREPATVKHIKKLQEAEIQKLKKELKKMVTNNKSDEHDFTSTYYYVKINGNTTRVNMDLEAEVLSKYIENDRHDDNKESSIKIRYAYVYNIPTADSFNESEDEEYIDILEIYLKNEELENVKKILEDIKFKEVDYTKYANINLAIGVGGMYEVTLDNSIVLLLDYPGDRFGQYTKGNESFIFEVTEKEEKLINEIDRIVQEKVNENFEKFSAEKITISSQNNSNVNITDKEHIKLLIENLKYVKVNIAEDEIENEEIVYTVDLNNGIKLNIYHASIIGKIIKENNEMYYVAFMTDYDEIVKRMYENYISGRNESIQAEQITVNYLGKKYIISDKDKVKYMIEKLKMSEYNSHDWLNNFDEKEYGNEDIIVKIGNNKIIIPGNRTIANRYFIDEKNNVYKVLLSEGIEGDIKELVGYQSK